MPCQQLFLTCGWSIPSIQNMAKKNKANRTPARTPDQGNSYMTVECPKALQDRLHAVARREGRIYRFTVVRALEIGLSQLEASSEAPAAGSARAPSEPEARP